MTQTAAAAAHVAGLAASSRHQVGDMVTFNDGFTGTQVYRVTGVFQVGLRVELENERGPLGWQVNAYQCTPVDPTPVDPAPAPAPATRFTVAPARTRTPRTAPTSTSPTMPAVTKIYRKTVFRNGRAQRQCWAATTKDGVWRITRVDDVGTPWQIEHIQTGRVSPVWYRRLDHARAAIGDGTAATMLTPADAAV